MNAQQLAEQSGLTSDAMRKRWKKVFPEKPFSKYAELTDTEMAALCGNADPVPAESKKDNKREQRKGGYRNGTSFHDGAAGPKAVSPSNSKAGLYALLCASTVASVWNVYQTTAEIADEFSALVLTIVFSVAAVIFVSTGVKNVLTGGVVGLLVLYEAVCNTVRIYGGLTYWDKAVPTRFLGIVCDIFGTGTYGTAVAIGAITAALIAGVQYASVFEIGKRA